MKKIIINVMDDGAKFIVESPKTIRQYSAAGWYIDEQWISRLKIWELSCGVISVINGTMKNGGFTSTMYCDDDNVFDVKKALLKKISEKCLLENGETHVQAQCFLSMTSSLKSQLEVDFPKRKVISL